jgi:PAP2 superfamily
MSFTIPVLLVGMLLPQAPSSAVDSAAVVTQDKKPDDSQEKKPPTPPHTGVHALLDGFKEDVRHLPSKPNLYLALLGGGLAAGVHPVDQTFNLRLRSQSDLVNDIFAPGKYFGDTPEQMALSIGTYAFGRIFDKPKVSHLGMDLLRAQMVTELLVEPIKFATHRERPDGSNHQSFPSGHAAITFAAATVIERHLGWKNSVLAYAIASYVAASRLHDNRHYLSDVVFGAAVGSIAGRTVVEHGREMWTFSPTPVPGGVAIMVIRTPQ